MWRPASKGRASSSRKHANGGDYRLLVIGNKLVAAAQRQAAQVVGDGVHTITQLVDEVNADPRRGEDHATCLSKIPLDTVSLGVLAEQGYTVDSVPPTGQVVLIRRNANLSTGGTAADITEQVHPAVAARAIEAARMVGLDVAGVDVVCEDIRRPLGGARGRDCRSQRGPGIADALAALQRPSAAGGRGHCFDHVCRGQDGRIPIVAVTGVNGKTTTTRFVSHIIRQTGRKVGMTCTEGIFIDDRRLESGDCSGPESAQKLLMNPAVEAGVFETARGGILRAGLAFDRCDVAVVTNIGEGDHLGLNDIETLDRLARVKRVPVEAVSPDGTAVLNAADPLVVEMAEFCPGKVMYFAVDAENQVIATHRAAGGRVVFVRDGAIVLAAGNEETVLLPVDEVPLTHGGRIGFQVENTLATVGAAWSLGLELEVIRAGLESFAADIDHVPGRFNLLEVSGAAVVVDYGHNVSSLAAMIDALKQFPHARRIAVYTAAGDRRDVDMIRQGELLGEAFDRVVLYEDHYVRGRQPGEIMRRFQEGLVRGDRVTQVEEVFGAVKAIEAVLGTLCPGDLVLLQADTVDETVDYVRRYLASHKTAREVCLCEALATAPAPRPRFTDEPISIPAPVGGSEALVAGLNGHSESSVMTLNGHSAVVVLNGHNGSTNGNGHAVAANGHATERALCGTNGHRETGIRTAVSDGVGRDRGAVD